eukprot:14420951-Ditylum_brightwellii.AAC.1
MALVVISFYDDHRGQSIVLTQVAFSGNFQAHASPASQHHLCDVVAEKNHWICLDDVQKNSCKPMLWRL